MMGQVDRINLTRVQRCHQDWASMPPIPGGRLCQQCSKRIVDFTRMSPAQIAQVHQDSEGPVCGMYRTEQLKLHLPPKANAGGWRAHPAMLSLISLLLLEPTSPVQAQVPSTEQVLPEADPPRKVASIATRPAVTADSLLLRGRVMEHHGTNERPVPYAMIQVKRTGLGTQTDLEGRFVLDVTELVGIADTVDVEMTYIGYARQSRRVALTDPRELNFTASDADAGPTVFAVPARKPPLYKRIWWGIQRPFRK